MDKEKLTPDIKFTEVQIDEKPTPYRSYPYDQKKTTQPETCDSLRDHDAIIDWLLKNNIEPSLQRTIESDKIGFKLYLNTNTDDWRELSELMKRSNQ